MHAHTHTHTRTPPHERAELSRLTTGEQTQPYAAVHERPLLHVAEDDDGEEEGGGGTEIYTEQEEVCACVHACACARLCVCVCVCVFV